MKDGWEFGWTDYAFIIGLTGVIAFYSIRFVIKFFNGGSI